MTQWLQEQEEKNKPPMLPPVPVTTKKAENSESVQSMVTGTDTELDVMLYADLDLDVKLSDAITGLKESAKNSISIKTEQAEGG